MRPTFIMTRLLRAKRVIMFTIISRFGVKIQIDFFFCKKIFYFWHENSKFEKTVPNILGVTILTLKVLRKYTS